MKLTTQIIGFLGLIFILSSFKSSSIANIKIPNVNVKQIDSVLVDTIAIDSSLVVYTPFMENAHASYYSDKFNGRNTASGEKFDIYNLRKSWSATAKKYLQPPWCSHAQAVDGLYGCQDLWIGSIKTPTDCENCKFYSDNHIERINCTHTREKNIKSK